MQNLFETNVNQNAESICAPVKTADVRIVSIGSYIQNQR